jgi:DNA-binding response OmpR family regulator
MQYRRVPFPDSAVLVLMFTAMEGELYETASLDAGADDFILKTTSIPSLVSCPRAISGGTKRRRLGVQTGRESQCNCPWLAPAGIESPPIGPDSESQLQLGSKS